MGAGHSPVATTEVLCFATTGRDVAGLLFFFFKQKTAYEIGWCDWSSDVCSSDLREAELARELLAVAGMALDDVHLGVGQATRLGEDRVGRRELADVVQQPGEREVAQAARRESEVLTDLHRPLRDAARVLLGRDVLGLQPPHQHAHPRAEERLLLGDQRR